MNKKTVIPIASGKGGVGKTVFAANLAIALAKQGHSTVVADLDLGGSNLYTCLGIPNKYPGIGDFLKSKETDFQKLIIETSIPGLRFLPGDGRTPFLANISYEQRLLLIKFLKKIEARYVILDLGAGTVFNTLNFFGLAHKGIIITTFETPSVMNFMMFLKNFLFRVISSAVRHDKKVLQMLIENFQQPAKSEPLTVKYLLEKIAELNPRLAEQVKKQCAAYHPRLVFNMGDHPNELNVLNKLDHALRQGLSVEADFLGVIFYDETVRVAAKRRDVLLTRYPKSIAARGIQHIAKQIARSWDTSYSISELMEDTQKQHKAWKSETGK